MNLSRVFGRETYHLPLVGCICLGYGLMESVAVGLEPFHTGLGYYRVSAALPVLGWLLGILLMPVALRRFSLKAYMGSAFALAVVSCAALLVPMSIAHSFDDQPAWLLGFRFVFGAAIGLFFRAYEYWLTTKIRPTARGRLIGVYYVVAVGSTLFGATFLAEIAGRANTYFVALALFFASGIWFALTFHGVGPRAPRNISFADVIVHCRRVPTAILVGFLFSSVSHYTTRVLVYDGLFGTVDEKLAVTLAFIGVVGVWLGAVPIGRVSDSVGRETTLMFCLVCGLLLLLLMLLSSPEQYLFYIIAGALAFLMGGLLVLPLAALPDNFEGDDLFAANMTYRLAGVAGAFVGPIVLSSLCSYGRGAYMVAFVLLFTLMLPYFLRVAQRR